MVWASYGTPQGWPPGPEESVAAVALGNELLDGDLQADLRIAQNCRIWSPNLGVFAVSAAGVLCAFPAWWTRYLDKCLRRTPGTNPLVAAVLRTKRLQRERCSATCQRRRRPG